MNLIDRAAHALATFQLGRDDWDKLDKVQHEQFKEGLRRALNTLRDPDEHMTEAGMEIIRNVRPGESETAHLNDAANTWRFMVDALLAGTSNRRLDEPD